MLETKEWEWHVWVNNMRSNRCFLNVSLAVPLLLLLLLLLFEQHQFLVLFQTRFCQRTKFNQEYSCKLPTATAMPAVPATATGYEEHKHNFGNEGGWKVNVCLHYFSLSVWRFGSEDSGFCDNNNNNNYKMKERKSLGIALKRCKNERWMPLYMNNYNEKFVFVFTWKINEQKKRKRKNHFWRQRKQRRKQVKKQKERNLHKNLRFCGLW